MAPTGWAAGLLPAAVAAAAGAAVAAGGRVAIGDAGQQLEAQLAGVQQALQAAGDAALHVKWRERGCIYQVLTDRGFAPEGAPPCEDLAGYCGGEYAPLAGRGLDYIEELGCDAVWISPVVEQVAGGYHGYWARDFNALNPAFGTAADLRHLKTSMEAKNMLLMVDAVFNHVGPVGMDFARLASPFDSEAAFHPRCQIVDWSNQEQVEQCRLADLPDIKQEDAGIRGFLLDWARNATGGTYGLVGTGVVADGLRIDTVPEVHPSFWRELADETGAFLAGEVFNGDAAYVARYQREALPSVLNYPAFFALRACFGPERRSLRSLEAFLGPSGELWRAFPDPHALVTFVDNHDNERWLHTGDAVGYANALAVQLLMAGIPW